MTVLEGIQKSAEFLTKKGIESSRLHSELLLAHVLKLPRMKLYLNFERALAPAEVEQLRELIQRRGRREPLQHIVGSTSFCALELAVNHHVLIPRPETELLAEAGWKFLAQVLHASRLNEGARTALSAGSPIPVRADMAVRAPVALDFGTGSGCIAIALAVNCPEAKVHAVDVSPEALAVAKQNAARHNVGDRIQFLNGDGFAALPAGTEFNLIIGNPPYIPGAEIESLQPEVRDYDPRTALDGGADGLDFYRRLAVEARPFLKSDGRIMLEFGDGQADDVRKIFETQNWIVEAIREDYTRRARIIECRRQKAE